MELKYKTPLKDIEFALQAAGTGDERYKDIPNIDELKWSANGDTMAPMLLESAGSLAQGELLPIYNKQGHVTYDPSTGVPTLPDGYEKAYKEYVEMGLQGISAHESDEGAGLPRALDAAVSQVIYAGNNNFGLIRALTKSVYEGISNNADDAQKGNEEGKLDTEQRNVMLKKLASGQWSGVMAMTEPKAGSDLKNITTKAELNKEDGSYSVTGGKIFISASDNEFAVPDKDGNIVHLVLTKIKDENGTDKGFSMMAVPKYQITEDGKPGEDNNVKIGKPEKKLGMHESVTTPVNYDGAKGWLVGERGQGMAAMFDVMNEARRAIGRQSLGIADIATQNALQYAATADSEGDRRRMGRATHGPESATEDADLISVHPPVREMLQENRAFVEGARVLDLITELEADKKDEDGKKWVQLTTNMIKYHFTEEGHASTDRAIQVFGGNGYMDEYRVGGLAQDARVPRIYEGTNQIQATTLVDRQLPNMEVFAKRVNEFLESAKGDTKYTAPLKESLEVLMAATQRMQDIQGKDRNEANAKAKHFVEMFSKVAVGYAWARQAELAQEKLKSGATDQSKVFLEAKLATANFYMQRLVPHVKMQQELIETGMETLEMPDLEQRRQDVTPAKQLAATPLKDIMRRLGKHGTPDAQAVAHARIERVHQNVDALPTNERRDVELAAAELKKDLSGERQGDPVAEAAKIMVNNLTTRKAVLDGSALAKLLEERDRGASLN